MANKFSASTAQISLVILCISLLFFTAITEVALRPFSKFAQNVTTASQNSGADSTSIANSSSSTFQHEAKLAYGSEIYPNLEDVTYSGNVSVSFEGEACFHFMITESAEKCPFPYIRVRLTGVALVHIPIRRLPESQNELQGCAWIPIPGVYYTEVHLIHCRMDPFRDDFTRRSNEEASKELKSLSGRPVWPDFTKLYNPHRFVVGSFHRQNYSVKEAWVFAPLCPGSLHRVSADCTKGSAAAPRYIPTKFQLPDWFKYNPGARSFKSMPMRSRYDGYMWLPVDSSGSIDYDADHFSYAYNPPPKFLEDQSQHNRNQTILFVGASHARILEAQVSRILLNLTMGRDACSEEYVHLPEHDIGLNRTRTAFRRVQFADDWLTRPKNEIRNQVGSFDKYIVTLGHWDAGYPRLRPTVPHAFINGLRDLIALVEELARPGAEVFVTSVTQHPMGSKMLEGHDWRIPPLIDAYNDMIRRELERVADAGPRSLRFKAFQRTFFLDNTDIIDPIWDSAHDFYHPCRYGLPPVALRVLDLLKI